MSVPPTHVTRAVLIDTSAYYALIHRREADHQSAHQILRGLQDDRYRLYTTNFVVAETHALILARLGRKLALRFLTDIRRSVSTTIVRVTDIDEEWAEALLTQFQDKEFSFVDALSFAVMERLGIQAAFSFDHHFAQYGCMVLTAERWPRS